MEVILKLGTVNDPGARVIIKADVKLTTVEGFDRWLKVQKLARDWLAKELAK